MSNGGFVMIIPTLKEVIDEAKKQHIFYVLRLTDGNTAKSAKILGITRKSLWSNRKKYKIEIVQSVIVQSVTIAGEGNNKINETYITTIKHYAGKIDIHLNADNRYYLIINTGGRLYRVDLIVNATSFMCENKPDMHVGEMIKSVYPQILANITKPAY